METARIIHLVMAQKTWGKLHGQDKNSTHMGVTSPAQLWRLTYLF